MLTNIFVLLFPQILEIFNFFQLELPSHEECRQWSLKLYILTETYDQTNYYIHPLKGILNEKCLPLTKKNVLEKENCIENPHLINLNYPDTMKNTYNIKSKVITRLRKILKTEKLPLTQVHVKEQSLNLWKPSSVIDRKLDDIDLNLNKFHLACVLLCDGEEYGFCISNLMTTQHRSKQSKSQLTKCTINTNDPVIILGTSTTSEIVEMTTMAIGEGWQEDLSVISVRAQSDETSVTTIRPEYTLIYLLDDLHTFDKSNYIEYKSQFFTNPYECLSKVVEAVGDKLTIIVSQSISKHLVPLIHDLIQVIYIYILHTFGNYHENEDDNYVNDKRYPKVRGSFIEQNMLWTKMNADLSALRDIYHQSWSFDNNFTTEINFDFYLIRKHPSSLKGLADQEQDFVFLKLLIEAILESDITNPFTDVNKSSKLYQISSSQIKNKLSQSTFNEFRKQYMPSKAINFYLTNTSLREDLNIYISNKDIEKICEWWFFIHDLFKQLPDSKKPIIVYHGEDLMNDEIQQIKDNVGGFMVSKNFFSMSTSNARAMSYSGKLRFDPHREYVLFQLKISDCSTRTKFSMLEQSSEETLFLFAASNVFRIESIEKINDKFWYCKLFINKENEEELTQAFQHYETEIGIPLTYLSLGTYLNEIGKPDLARKYYGILLQVSNDPDVISSIQNNLAIISNDENESTIAVGHLADALKAQKIDKLKVSTVCSSTVQSTSDIILATPVSGTSQIISCYNLACAYRINGNFNAALEECDTALNLTTNMHDSADIVLVYAAKGSVYYSQQNYADALKFFKMALDIALLHLPTTDPLIDQYLNNVRILTNII
ncbi:unnamed protein product [Rotaria sp. Silwood2]|nr:unnamed protein product [Rotaria sp. Silwood2]